jgi:hypothetical protein
MLFIMCQNTDISLFEDENKHLQQNAILNAYQKYIIQTLILYFHTLTYGFTFSNIDVMELKGLHFQCKTVLQIKLRDWEKSWPPIDIVQPLNSCAFMYNNFSLMEVHYWCKTILHRHPMTIGHSQF